VPAKTPPRHHRLRIVVLNDSAPVLKMLCKWLEQHGHHCDTALLADMPRAHEEVGQFIQKHRPDLVIYDVGMPYASSWDLLEVIRTSPGVPAAAVRYYDSKQAKTRTSRGPHVREGDRGARYGPASRPQSGRSSGGRVRRRRVGVVPTDFRMPPTRSRNRYRGGKPRVRCGSAGGERVASSRRLANEPSPEGAR